MWGTTFLISTFWETNAESFCIFFFHYHSVTKEYQYFFFSICLCFLPCLLRLWTSHCRRQELGPSGGVCHWHWAGMRQSQLQSQLLSEGWLTACEHWRQKDLTTCGMLYSSGEQPQGSQLLYPFFTEEGLTLFLVVFSGPLFLFLCSKPPHEEVASPVSSPLAMPPASTVP